MAFFLAFYVGNHATSSLGVCSRHIQAGIHAERF